MPILPTLGLCLLMVMQQAFSADINVTLDRNPVSQNDSFAITFTATEEPDDEPDFSPLEQDFSIINQNQSSSSSWINGKFSKTIEWTLTVMAKSSGNLTIPAIAFGDDRSPAKTVQVTQAAVKQGIDSEAELFLEVEASPTNPYLQAQVLYTVRLYSRVQIAQASLNAPELDDAVVEKLGDDVNYNTEVGGVQYAVTERKYAIFPQKSGKLTIKPLKLTAAVMANRRNFNSFFNSQFTQTKQVASKSVTLDVKPALTGQHWLPAEQLELRQEWSGDFTQMKVGEPLTRTLTIEATGTGVGQLPELGGGKIDAQVKVYPDQPVLTEQKNGDGLMAVRQEKLAVIPSKAGSYTLPAIEVPWFNTKTQALELAKIPEMTITATGGAVEPALAPVTAEPTKPAPALSVTPQAQITQEPTHWFWIAIGLAVGWLLTVVYFLLGRPKKSVAEPKPEKSDSSGKKILKDLKKACAENNADAAKQALLVWGKQQFDAPNLGTIAECCEARLRDEILNLNAVLYGRNPAEWVGKKLFQAFTEHKARAKFNTPEDQTLEPLYRL